MIVIIARFIAVALLAAIGPRSAHAAGEIVPTASPPAIGASAGAERCHANFTVHGSRFSGFTLKTFDEYPTVAPSRAFRALAQAMAADSGTLQNANEKTGTISALGALGPGGDAGHPVNGLVVPLHDGSRVELSWSVGGLVMFHKNDVESRFCTWLNRISRAESK